MALKDSKMSKQGLTGKIIKITSTIPQKIEIIRRLKSGGGEPVICWIVSYL
jgi:hypothetical protein